MMTSDDTLFTHEVLGRSIVCRRLLPGQFMMLQRLLGKWQSELGGDDADDVRARELFDKINMTVLDVLEAQIVDAADVEWLTQQLLFGKVDLVEVQNILFGGRKEAPGDDEPKVKVPVKAAVRKAARKPVKGAGRVK